MAIPPQLSVIIPTYNRVPILTETLKALLTTQQGDVPPWEILVVDDGSTDETPSVLESMLRLYPSRLRAFRQPNLKQGAARNLAMRHARGHLFVFLGDDIVPSPHFLERHWRGFVSRGKPPRHGLIGRTLWHPRIGPSPFRQWINEWGLQFGFQLIQDPENVPFNFFYTSNLSFSRDLYDDFGGFDESFDQYGWEDIELGYRYMQKGGMRLRYDSEAVAYHDHNITVKSFCRRQYHVGFSAVRFGELHPELHSFLHLQENGRRFLWVTFLGMPLAAVLSWCDERLGWMPLRLTAVLMRGYYVRGMMAARRDKGRQKRLGA
ncbi:glycosyltransferase family 2 protein [Desulfosoma sp.]